MNDELVAVVIRLAAGQCGREPAAITPATHFVNDLKFDSLDTMDYVMKLEEEFGVRVADEDVPGLQTVQAVIDYLAARGATAGSSSGGTPSPPVQGNP